MRLICPKFQILNAPDDPYEFVFLIEAAARTCYKSEAPATNDPQQRRKNAEQFVGKLLARGHHSTLEHAYLSVRFTVDRGVSHEIVRHRLASYSQESTRYCNYSHHRFGAEIACVDMGKFLDGEALAVWLETLEACERGYFRLLELGKPPEIARSLLPTCTKTELVMTANIREWRHFFELRTAQAAHPQMRQVTRPLLSAVRKKIAVLFSDVGVVDAC